MNPFTILLALFLIVPLVEIYLLIQVGGVIGAIPTIALVVFTAVLGALLLRLQGLETLRRVQLATMHGEIPAMAMLEGVVLLISGALLLTPGFFTDALGFLGLIPPVRRWAIRAFVGRGVVIPPGSEEVSSRGPVTIEGECRREHDD